MQAMSNIWQVYFELTRRLREEPEQTMENGTWNGSLPRLQHDPLNYWWLLLSLVPLGCVFGNTLVVAAVWTTRGLQTPTNYLLVSLAVADLLVGLFVMPFSVYLAVSNLHWHLSLIVCNFFIVMDVSASTASIVHLVVISVDRFVAVARHTEYKSRRHKRRVYAAITFCWLFSVTIGMPLGIGLNAGDHDTIDLTHHCGIVNPTYMLYSSIFAFYIPCVTMLATYSYIFYRLRKRLQVVQLQELVGGNLMSFGADVGNIARSAIGLVNAATNQNQAISWEKPLLRRIEQTVVEHDSDLTEAERHQISTILETNTKVQQTEEKLRQIVESSMAAAAASSRVAADVEDGAADSAAGASLAYSARRGAKRSIARRRFSEAAAPFAQGMRRMSCLLGPAAVGDHNLMHAMPAQRTAGMRRLSEAIYTANMRRDSSSFSRTLYEFARRESLQAARQKLSGLKEWALDLLAKLKSRQGIHIRRETRATKLVATVLVVFLVCWLPFFTLNIYKVIMLWSNSWTESLEALFVVFSWLGYVNSCLNPLIYSLINSKYRIAFRRLLGLERQAAQRRKTWMLPPKKARQRQRRRHALANVFSRRQYVRARSKRRQAVNGNAANELRQPAVAIELIEPTSACIDSVDECEQSYFGTFEMNTSVRPSTIGEDEDEEDCEYYV